MSFGITRITHALIVALIVLAPYGTRLILDIAHAKGVPVEASTHSVFMSQLLAIVVVWAVLQRTKGRLGGFALPERLALVLVALVAVSAAVSVDPYAASALAMRLALGVALFIAVSRSGIPVRTAVWALVVMAAVQGSVAFLQVYSQNVISDTAMGVAGQMPADLGVSVVETAQGRWLRAYGTLPHPNVLGIVGAVGALAGAWLVVELPVAYMAAALTALASFGMMLSFSRTALIAFVAGLVSLAVEGWRRPCTRPKYVVAVLVIAIIAISTVASMPEAWITRVSVGGRLESVSVGARMQSLRDGADLVAIAPVLGVGPGLSQQAIASLHPDREGWSLEPPHMVPVAIAAEAGIPAMLAWIVFVAALLGAALRYVRRNDMVPLSAALLAVVAASFLDHYFWTVWPGQLMFWLVCGLFWAGVRRTYAPKDASLEPIPVGAPRGEAR